MTHFAIVSYHFTKSRARREAIVRSCVTGRKHRFERTHCLPWRFRVVDHG